MRMDWLIIALTLFVFWRIWYGYKQGPTFKTSSRAPKPPRQQAPLPVTTHHWPPSGDFDFEIVGESNYQEAIRGLAGEHDQYGAATRCVATLVPEDDNPYDDKAVRVDIDGQTVGYLCKEDARSFRRRLGAKKLSGQVTTCDAVIKGGGTRKSGERLHYGVQLDMKPFY